MAENPPSTAVSCYETSKTVIILAGRNEVSFTVHQAVIERDCPFFQAALREGFREGQERIIRLPGHRKDTVNLYVASVYRGSFVLALEEAGVVEEEVCTEELRHRAVKLYCLAHYTQNIRLQNQIMDYLVFQSMALTFFETVGLVYRELPETSKLRQYVLDLLLPRASSEWIKSVSSELPRELVAEIASGLARQVKTKQSPMDPRTKGACYYHEQSEGETC